jgi:flagellar hook assembly protein FlgD
MSARWERQAGPLLLGPSGRRGDDHFGMALESAYAEPWRCMSKPQRPAAPSPGPHGVAYRREVTRLLAVILAVIALILTSSALNWVTEARAADEASAPRKAVVVSGPVHSLTDRYKDYARAIADAAAAQGMQVTRIFHPNATKARVKKYANGAHLFVYVGHGNGWPSPYGPFQENTKNGLGLNPDDPALRTTYNVDYKGANWLRANIELAPNAVVILSHLSYASGNASSGMPIPSRSVAVERVDNFANGFLSIGARVVWALGWQPGADVVDALHREDATMNALFMTRYRSGVNPLNGWIGHDPGYYPSVRIPGATIHIDPDPSYGFLRGITGDLAFTTTEWRDPTARPVDLEPPVISGVSASQAAVTLATVGSGEPVFTPNGDGLSDTIAISHRLSENAFVEMQVKKDGKLVRRSSNWALAGAGSLTWDGRRDDGNLVGEGQFKIILTPTDRAGNVGQPAEVNVRVLNSMRNPSARPTLFYPSDGDELAATTALKARITRDATVSLTLRDARGDVVRRGIDEAALSPGPARFVWDGTDDAGAMVPEGRYTARIRVTRPQGSYAHDVTLQLMPFQLRTKTWSVQRGDTITLTLLSAEPLKGKPVVVANQPGIKKYQVPRWKITRLSETSYKVVLKTRAAGKPGEMKVRVVGTDIADGTQSKVFTLKLR